MESKLFKEAIADAKAVRSTALANAKVALDNALSEHFAGVLGEKLRGEAFTETETDEVGINPIEDGGLDRNEIDKVEADLDLPPDLNNDPVFNDGLVPEENISESEIEELISELEEEAEQEAANTPPEPQFGNPAGVPPAPAGDQFGAPAGFPPAPPAPAGDPFSQASMPPAPAAGGQFGAPFGAPTPPVPPPVPGANPPPAVGAQVPPSDMAGAGYPQNFGAGAAQTPPPSDAGNEELEEVNLEELLESLKAELEEDALLEQTKLDSSGIGGGRAGASSNPTKSSSSSSKLESGNDEDGFPSLDQPKVVAKEHDQVARPNRSPNATKSNLSTPSLGGGNASGGNRETGFPKLGQPRVVAKDPTDAARPNRGKNATASNLSTPSKTLSENLALRRKLNDAKEVIRYIKGQLNEVNLLNAKLLYTNKLFKEFNMNKEPKMRIIEMFDLAKNVREVKLTYANIAESLSFGGKGVQRKSNASVNVRSITEGLASGAVGSTKPSRTIISEGAVNQMATRFQKLAGIKMSSK